MRKKAQTKSTAVFNKDDYEPRGQDLGLPAHYFDGNDDPLIIIRPDGQHDLVDASRDGLVTRVLKDEETQYGVLEAEFLEI